MISGNKDLYDEILEVSTNIDDIGSTEADLLISSFAGKYYWTVHDGWYRDKWVEITKELYDNIMAWHVRGEEK